jgi:predicted dehydrogenase
MSSHVAFIGKQGEAHQSNYLDSLPLMAGVDRVSVCDLAEGADFAKARSSLGEMLVATYTDVDACLAAGSYSFVIVSLDNLTSNGVVMQTLKAGNHVFAEKTAGRTYAEFKPLEDYAKANNLHLGMAYLNRTRPSVLHARDLFANGAIGKLYGFYVQSVANQARTRNPEGNWTFSAERAGGGYLIWLGCHYIDLLRWITGHEVTSVGAITDVVSDTPLEVEDAAALTMRLDNGAVGTANFGYYLDGTPPRGSKQSEITLWGECGWIRMQPGEDDVPVELHSSHPDYASAPYRTTSFTHANVPKAYGSAWGLHFLDNFAAVCRGQAVEPIITVRDAGAVMQIIDAAYESSRTGRFIPVSSTND